MSKCKNVHNQILKRIFNSMSMVNSTKAEQKKSLLKKQSKKNVK